MERVARDNADFALIDRHVRSLNYQVLTWSVDGDQSIFRCIRVDEDPGEAFEITTANGPAEDVARELLTAITRRLEQRER